MIGSAFVVYNDSWACSNEVKFGVYTTPILDENKKPVSVFEEKTITVFSPFFYSEKKPNIGDKCEVVMMNDDSDEKFAFIGQLKSIGEQHFIVKIHTKSERIKEILSNITFKN